MKRILSAILCFALLVSALAIVGCGESNLKLGLGVVMASAKGTNATAATDEAAAKNGSASVDVTAAAVLVDENGKIVKVVIDTMQNKGAYTASGTAVAAGEFKTKLEKGDAYGMAKAEGQLEWYEQADAFESLCIGKTASELSGLIAEGYGVADVKNAGCTIYIGDFVAAAVKAAD